ncbi:MAG: hypothetical protein K8R68_01970, partial [Bacteroidales bacterium]|nr:hypothetical protein [Bacteroidales bacterium]
MYIEIIENIKKYLKYLSIVYKNDEYFKDIKSGTMPLICAKSSSFYKNSIQKMIAVKTNKKILCQAVLIKHRYEPEILSIAFFEAIPNVQHAVDFLISYAEGYGKNLGCKKIVIPLDGHCSYSVGFSKNSNRCPIFGENYNKEYYLSYFNNFKIVNFVSYYDSVVNIDTSVHQDFSRIKKYKNLYTLKYADFGRNQFKNTVKRYTDLQNKIFSGHRYYFHRDYDEDIELFSKMRYLLKNDNLIIAQRSGIDVGFLLWFPDYQDLVKIGRSLGFREFIKYRLFGKAIFNAKVAQIGIDEKYRSHGVIVMLFEAAIKTVIQNYP